MMLTWETVGGISILLALAGALNALILHRALSNFEERLIAKLDLRYVLKTDLEIELLRKGMAELREQQ